MDEVTKNDKDTLLLSLLAENARTPIAELARQLGLSRTTVQARIERLERGGAIAGYTVRLSTAAERALVRAYVMITVRPRHAAPTIAGHARGFRTLRRLLEDGPLRALTLAIEPVQRPGDLRSPFRSRGGQQFHGLRSMPHTPARIQAGAEHESGLGRPDLLPGEVAGLEKRIYTGELGRFQALQTEPGNDPVLIQQGHDVRDRGKPGQREQVQQHRSPCVGEAIIPVGQRAEPPCQFEGDPRPRQLAPRVRVAAQPGVDDLEGLRQAVRGVRRIVMIRDNQVEPREPGPSSRLERGDPAIHRDHDPHALPREGFEGIPIQAVALIDAMGHIGRDASLTDRLRGYQRHGVVEDRAGTDPIDIVIAIDRDPLPRPQRRDDPFRSPLNAGQQSGVMHSAEARFAERSSTRLIRKSPGSQHPCRERLQRKSRPDRLPRRPVLGFDPAVCQPSHAGKVPRTPHLVAI